MANYNYNQNFACSGLTTLTTAIQVAGVYPLQGKITLPQLVEGNTSPSAAVMTITQQGSTIYTGTAGAEGFYTVANCAAGDVLTFALSSAAAIDQGLNVLKFVVAIG